MNQQIPADITIVNASVGINPIGALSSSSNSQWYIFVDIFILSPFSVNVVMQYDYV